MIGPVVKIVAQLAAVGAMVLARALPAAYAKALQNAKKGGSGAASATESILQKNKLQLSEALQIMNIGSESEVTAEIVQKQYDKYFAANAVKNGGSFYLQSKIYRSKELLDEFIKEKRQEEKEAATVSTKESKENNEQSDKETR